VKLTPPAWREYCCSEWTCGIRRAYVSSRPETYFYTGPDPDSYFEMDRIPKVLMSIQGERQLRPGFEALTCGAGTEQIGEVASIPYHSIRIVEILYQFKWTRIQKIKPGSQGTEDFRKNYVKSF
jgi:hypothetical protein